LAWWQWLIVVVAAPFLLVLYGLAFHRMWEMAFRSERAQERSLSQLDRFGFKHDGWFYRWSASRSDRILTRITGISALTVTAICLGLLIWLFVIPKLVKLLSVP